MVVCIISISLLFLLYARDNFSVIDTRSLPIPSFTCKGYSNMVETYLLRCPLPVETKQFEFKNHLKCKTVTNHQFHLDRTAQQRGDITISKADNIAFHLDIKSDMLIRSKNPGTLDRLEHYSIIKHDNEVIQAVRPTQDKHIDTSHQYEFITLSKNTGYGMEVMHNVEANTEKEPWRDDSIISFFFVCE